MSKSTAAEFDLRVKEVAELLFQRKTRSHIVHYGSKKWSVSHRQCDDYIAAAWDIHAEIVKVSLAQNLSIALQNYYSLVTLAYDRNELPVVRAALSDISKLQGLCPETILILQPEERPHAAKTLEELKAERTKERSK